MKLIHLSDLHIGKKLNEYNLIEDQKYILDQILEIIKNESPDGIMIAGDIYDKSTPSLEAVNLLDDFLVKLSKLNIPTYISSGNHDSADRLAFASRLIDESGIHFSRVYDGNISKYVLKDEYGDVNIYMLPFIKPATVKPFFEDIEISNYTDAVKLALSKAEINKDERNVLLSHQFVTGALRSESEINVGGIDNVDSTVYEDFDYVALGHIHKPQKIKENIRYSGTPLKYSFSEMKDKKNVLVVELKEKGSLEFKEIELKPMRDLKEIKGKYDELMLKDYYEGTDLKDSYLRIVLTDEEEKAYALQSLRTIYPFIMEFKYDNTRTRANAKVEDIKDIENKSPFELFEELYKTQNNQDMSDEQKTFAKDSMNELWEE